jgi:hypothetical protein
MKKVICLAVVVLLIAAVAFAAAKKVPITEKNLKSVKGTWEGTLSYGLYFVETGPVTLEILTDTVPVKGKVTLDVPQTVASQYAVQSGKQTKENPDGKLTPQGTILWTGGGAANHSVEAWLTDDNKLHLFYYFMGMKGDASLTKKK